MAVAPSETGGSEHAKRPERRRRRWWILAGIFVLIVGLVGGGLWWYLQDDAPAEVDLETATRSVGTEEGDEVTDLSGTWTVDADSGSFDFSSATGTFAGFRVSEELSGIGSTTAVGRTGSVSGSMTIAGDKVTEATFTVDMTSITSDRPRRDSRVQDALDTSEFPTATFVLDEPIALPADAMSGEKISLEAHGNLTIHGVTKDVVMPLEAQLEGGTVVVVGSTEVMLSDYGVEAPSARIVLSVADEATMELQLLLTRN